MRCFTVHSVCKSLLELNLDIFTITFDDALYSQYFYWEHFKRFKTKKILFIPTGAIRLTDECRPTFSGEYINFPDCYKAMQRWKKNNDRKDYMTLGEIKFLINNSDIRIGGHGHGHYQPDKFGRDLFEISSNIKKDIDLMFGWFDKNLSIRPVDYCYPFNEYNYTLNLLLKDRGIKRFYGPERIETNLCLERK